MMKANKQGGFSINELGIYLLIVAVLASLGYAGYNYYVQSEMGRKTGEAVAQSIRKVTLRHSGNFSSVTVAGLISTSTFDNPALFNVDRSSGTISHRMGNGGAITIASTDGDTTASWSLAGVPSNACENIVLQTDVVAYSIVVGMTVVKAPGAARANLDLVSCQPQADTVITIVAKA